MGVVSETDIAESESERTSLVGDYSDPEFDVRGWEDVAAADELRGLHVEGDDRVVEDIMTPAAYTIRRDTPVAEIAHTMIAGRIHRLLVTREQQVVGIVTSLDLLKLLCPQMEQAEVRRRRPVLVRS